MDEKKDYDSFRDDPEWRDACLENERSAALKNQTEVRMGLLACDDKQRQDEWAVTLDALHGHVVYSEDVTQEGVLSFTAFLRRWDRLQKAGTDLTMEMNSPGGEIIAGLHLFDSLRLLRRRHSLTIRVLGEACSMAGVLLQAAGQREIGKHAYIMLHRASFGAAGTADQVEDQVEQTKMFEATVYGILAERTGKSIASWKSLLGKRKDVWFDAKDALKHGLVDAIA